MLRSTPGHSVGVIVHDFGVDVNAYAAFGTRPPLFRPSTCPACMATDTLWSHGVRARCVWLGGRAVAVEITVRRLRCRGCSRTFTVLPCFVHPRRRYALQDVQDVVVARFIEGHSFSKIEDCLIACAPSTQRDWCKAFSVHASVWLASLMAWLSQLNAGATLPVRTRSGSAPGLLAAAVHCFDWIDDLVAGHGSAADRLLESLWLWGSSRVKVPLLASTRCRAGP